MGAVTLKVGNLDALIDYYRDGVTLEVLRHEGPVAELGRRSAVGDIVLLRLEHSPELRAPEPRSAGLFHTAFLFENQRALAAAVYSVATRYPSTFTGSADHLVSEAFYFTDPEGNGVELYTDRERSQWSWTHGRIEMDTLSLDPNDFISRHLATHDASAGQSPESIARVDSTTVGHVHLSVGNIAQARDFYVSQLGFDETTTFGPSALFVSAGGYHHHMAMNTWNSSGAGKRGLALGLGTVDIVVPSTDDVVAITDRMKHFGIDTRDDGKTVRFEDPWNNLIEVRAS